MTTIGLYIHIPFCEGKCPYCDFYSVDYDDGLADAYTAALCRAIRTQPFGEFAVDTVYFGGGTPFLMGERRLSLVLEEAARCFSFAPNIEITLEANPSSTVTDRLYALRKAGFNRVSFGVQSCIDDELRALGRRHTSDEACAAVSGAAKAGFDNISADLMLGIPCQKPESLARSIRVLTELPVSHISAYILKIEPETPFGKRRTAPVCPNEDEVARLYLDCVKQLQEAGFLQYEISNFAKDDRVSRHNLKYWNSGEYLGIGPAAHSYINGERFYFERDLNKFLNAEKPFSLTVADGGGGGFEEYAMLRLRLADGLDLVACAEKYPETDRAGIISRAKILESHGLARITGDTVSLTPEGFLLSNPATAKLLFG